MHSDSPDPPPGDPADEGRRLTLLYVFALSTVALLSIGAQLLIQRQLSNGESDSRVINIAGRQRMLSQRLAKASLQTAAAPARPGPRQELQETLRLWAGSHDGLQNGDPVLGLPGSNSEEVAGLFAAIEPDFRAMKAAAQRLLANPALEPDLEAVGEIQSHEAAFLAGMDAIVSQYVDEAERKVARLRRLESAILSLTLVVLLAEGLLIFRPAVQRIEQTVKRLGTLSQRLGVARDQAEEASAAKTRFLANVSHELRTPMTAVLGMTELAREEDDPVVRDRFLSIVDEAGGSLLGLLNDLIDLARIDAGQLQMAAEPFSPRHVIERVARIMEVSARAKQLRLTTASGVDPRLWVVGDAGRLEQVLLNLVANAIKATDSGDVSVGCTLVKSSPETAQISYTVRDTGVGIDPDDQERMFEPFVQGVDSVAAGAAGAGLGLAICRKIADAMNAKISVLSTKGFGSTLTLTAEFPIAEAASAPAPQAAAPNSAPLSVLVVEDTPVNQILLRELLSRAGHIVRVASSGEEALAVYADEVFDAVLIDLQLPGIGGRETAEAIRAAEAGRGASPPPLLCVTARAGASLAGREAAAFDALVTKPLDRESLLRTLSELAGAARQREAAGVVAASAALTETAPDLFRELAVTYLRAAAEQRDQLAVALREERWRDARVLAHRFGGQVAYFNAEALADRLAELQSACDREDAAAAAALAAPVLQGLDELASDLATATEGPVAAKP